MDAEWTELDPPVDIYEFKCSDRAKVGMLLRLRGRSDAQLTEKLIGDINDSLGECGCCNIGADGVDVIAFKQVWTPETGT